MENEAPQSPWRLSLRYYWISVSLVALGFAVGYLAVGDTRAAVGATVYLLSGGLLYLTLGRDSRLAVGLHQVVALGVMLWQSLYGQPIPGLSPAALWGVVQGFGLLVLLTCCLYLGVRAAVVTTLAYVALIAYPSDELLMGVPAAVAAAMGVMLHFQLKRLEATQRQLERLAIQDPLTGVLNRRLLESEFARYHSLANRQRLPFVVISWDMDGLKRLNDLRGHAEGDRQIVQLVKTLKSTLRQEDIIFRTGGDEFLSLHLGTGNPQELIHRVTDNFLEVSAGWVDATHLTLERAVTQADEAMYLNKRKRRMSRSQAP